MPDLKTLSKITGAENCLPSELCHIYKAAGVLPSLGVVFPDTVEQVSEIIKACAADGLSLIPTGGATSLWRSARPEKYDVALVTTRLDRITDYQTENLVFAAEAGMTGDKALAALSRNRQFLPLDPPHFHNSTLGGIAAKRASGPARLLHGTPRDFVIGLSVIDAQGKLIKAGGKVVKNVSGYDMCKLYTGSMGTLGVIVETVFKVSPTPMFSKALAAGFDNWSDADKVVAALMDSSLYPRCIELLNKHAGSDYSNWNANVTLLAAFDGSEEQVRFQLNELTQICRSASATSVNKTDFDWWSQQHRRYADMEDVPKEGSLFIVQGLSSDVPAVCSYAENAFQLSRPLIFSSAGSGVTRIVIEESTLDQHNQNASLLSALVKSFPGATLKAFTHKGFDAEHVYSGCIDGLDLMKGIKIQLDPNGVFAMGRFAGGI